MTTGSPVERRAGVPSGAAGGDPPGPDDAAKSTARLEGVLADAVEKATLDVRRLCDTVVELVRLEGKRLRLRLIDGAFGAGMALLGFRVASAAAIAGALLVIWGARTGLVRLLGRFDLAWLGDVVAGLAVIGALAGAAAWARARTRRRTLGPPPAVLPASDRKLDRSTG